MTEMKIIKTESEYNAALGRIETLMDAAEGSAGSDELELLVLLVEKYEQEHFPILPPDPVEAIRFRMEQEGLTARDMVAYLGTQSRVSEVLNRKRSLSLKMIRNLHQALDIPLESLIQGVVDEDSNENSPLLDNFTYFYSCDSPDKAGDVENLKKWQLKVLKKAQKQELPPFKWEKAGKWLVEEILGLCGYSAGPRMTRELLNKHGIYLIIQEKQADFEIDGACFIVPGRNPIIGMTMQKNGWDDFWYTLLRLVAHITLRQRDQPVAIFDSIECSDKNKTTDAGHEASDYLKTIIESSTSLRPTWQAYQKAVNLTVQKKTAQQIDIDPQVFSCWYRIDHHGKNANIKHSSLKKISETLEVYNS